MINLYDIEKSYFKTFNMFKKTKVPILKKINLSIQKGEIVGLIGPNGCGKSTLIKVISGVISPDKGEVKIKNLNYKNHKNEILKDIGIVFGQKTQLWWDLPVIESYYLLKEIYNIPSDIFEKRLKMYISEFHMENIINLPVRNLSLGQRVKSDFIASILHLPKLLILDEPTIGLDLKTKSTLRKMIKKLNKLENTTILMTTHDNSDIEELCSRIVVLNHGEIIYDEHVERMEVQEFYKKTLTFEVEEKNVLLEGHIFEKNTYGWEIEVSDNHEAKEIIYLLNKKYNLLRFDLKPININKIIDNFY